MKVICIAKSKWSCKNNPNDNTGPSFGEIVTASNDETNDNYYNLNEYPLDKAGNIASYNKHFFIPLSTIDEPELLEQRKQLLTQNI